MKNQHYGTVAVGRGKWWTDQTEHFVHIVVVRVNYGIEFSKPIVILENNDRPVATMSLSQVSPSAPVLIAAVLSVHFEVT